MLSKQSMRDVFIFRIKVVNDDIGIARMTSSENNNLKIFWQMFKNFFGIWADIDSSFNNFSSWEFNWQFNVIRHVNVFITVNQGFIQVENNSFSI